VSLLGEDEMSEWEDVDDAIERETGCVKPMDFEMEEALRRRRELDRKNVLLGVEVAELDHADLKRSVEQRRSRSFLRSWFGM